MEAYEIVRVVVEGVVEGGGRMVVVMDQIRLQGISGQGKLTLHLYVCRLDPYSVYDH